MMMLVYAEPPDRPEIDSFAGVRAMCEYRSPLFELPDREIYRAWSEDQRDAFNLQRIQRLGSDLVIRTQPMLEMMKELRKCYFRSLGKVTGKFGIVVEGMPNSGKTTICYAAMQRFWRNFTQVFPDGLEDGAMPIVYVLVPPNTTGKAMLMQFAEYLGIPDVKGTLVDLKRSILSQMKRARTRLIVIDEAQQLLGNSGGSHHSAQVVKALMNVSPAMFVLAGYKTDESPLFAGPAGAQIAGRCELLEVTPFDNATPEGAAQWNGVLERFGNSLGLYGYRPGALQPHSNRLFERTNGNIASLNAVLTGAATEIFLSDPDPGDEVLTEALLERTPADAGAPQRGRPRLEAQ